MNTNETSPRPPGYWFGVIEYRLREKMRGAFTELDLSRGEWRILHTLTDGPQSVDDVESALPPGERHRRMGARFGRTGRGFGPGYGPGFGPAFGYGPWFARGFGPGFGPWRAFAEEHADAHTRAAETGEHPAQPQAQAQGEHPEHAGHEHPAHPGHEHHDHPGHGAFPGHGDHHGHHGDFGYDHHRPGYGHRDHAAEGGEKGVRGERRRPRSVAEVLVSFTERGWVVLADGAATLTDAGRATHDEAESRVKELRASVSDGIDDADYQTTMATLEKMARNLGWTDDAEADTDGDASNTDAGEAPTDGAPGPDATDPQKDA
ncbi:hypothetical protein [Diaminobutyricibacter sp. McL0608]|uniref:hypothetical protein n=1 Tax=Leifsonia sp. McL0608 TaxID=3143537 RepID=UPI0031F2F73E